MLLTGFGETGQHKLGQAKVLMIGAGGLGCAALPYLAAAGVGTIGIVDHDTVSLSNLHRQVLYASADIGLPKAVCAQTRLQSLNTDILVDAFNQKIDPKNALDIIVDFDIVIDGTDNFATRYMINDACVLLGKTLIYGAISRFEGQLAVFNHPDAGEAVNYRDLFPQPPGAGEVPDCAEAGVLGVLPGIIGVMQANEAIKVITGIGQPLLNRLLSYNALNNTIYEVTITARKDTPARIPKDAEAFRNTDYDWFCGMHDPHFTIDFSGLENLLRTKPVEIIDIRELHETPAPHDLFCRRIPLSLWKDKLPAVERDTVVVVCQTGARSLHAAKQLADIFGKSKTVYSLHGGVVTWNLQAKNKQSNGKET